jgi:hypothetical protein
LVFGAATAATQKISKAPAESNDHVVRDLGDERAIAEWKGRRAAPCAWVLVAFFEAEMLRINHSPARHSPAWHSPAW